MKSKIHEHKKSNSKAVSKNFYIGLFLLLITYSASGQIITIPDANFKAKLLQADVTNNIALTTALYTPARIDTNNNGEIEVSEAHLITGLSVGNSNISTLSGIEAFVNLVFLQIGGNQITQFNPAPLSNLNNLLCANNQLSSLDLSQNTALTQINVSYNFLTQLILPILPNNLLQACTCSHNQLSAIDVVHSLALTYLDCSYNLFSQFELPNSDTLTSYNFAHNQLSSIDLSHLNNFISIDLSYNNLSSLDFSNPNQTYLTDGSLMLQNNPLVHLDMSQLRTSPSTTDAFGQIEIANTLLSEITLPPVRVRHYGISNNPNLVSINFKNGLREVCAVPTEFAADCGISIYQNPNLSSMCVDEVEFDYFTNRYLGIQILTNCSLSSENTERRFFTLSPNPTLAILNITLSGNQTITKTTVSTILGQTIMMFGNQNTIDISSLNKGIYFVTVETDSGKATQRIIKQ